MISNDLIQAAIIAKLKADNTLVNWLSALDAGAEIREAQWQGTVFVYPAVRVDLGTQVPLANGACHINESEIPFTVYSMSEADSSRQADILAGLVNSALFTKRISGSGWTSLVIDSDGLISAAREAPRFWRATGLYRVRIYGTA
jgi:hypothetical protein